MGYTGEQSRDSVKQLVGKIRILFFREISGHFDFFFHTEPLALIKTK